MLWIEKVYTEFDLWIPSDHHKSIIVWVMEKWWFKFVVAMTWEDNLAVAISQQGVYHSGLAKALLENELWSTFFWAWEGKIDALQWWSNSCREVFWFDKPQSNSPETNKVLLEDIRKISAEKIAELMAKYSHDELGE